MAYNITTTAGTSLATIADGTVNTSATSLTLIGKNYAGYGNFLNENVLKLLENFAYITSPANPIMGQLWYDSGNNVIKLYNGSVWKTLASSVSQPSQPGYPQIGDMWWDTTNSQLKVWGGTVWVTIGPTYTSVSGTSGAIVETINDSGSNSHVVVKFYISNQVIAILSNSGSFVPQTAITGFAVINPGLNLISKSALAGSQLTGDVSNALTLQGVTASQFIRSDQNSGTAYQLTAGGGLLVGSDLVVNTTSGSEVKVLNQTSNKDLNFYINQGGLTVKAIGITGTTAGVAFSNTVAVGTTLSVNGATTLNSTLLVTGTLTAGATIVPLNNQTINIGNVAYNFANIYATNFVGSLQGNVTATTVAGTLQTAAQPNVTSLGTLANVTATGNITTTGGFLNGIGGIYGTILTPTQNQITYVGTLGNLVVTGPVQLGQTLNTNGFLTGNVNGVVGGIYQSWQIYQLQGSVTGANNNTAQSILGTGTGATLSGSTIYEFEGLFALDKSSGTTLHQLGLSFASTNGLMVTAITYQMTTYESTTGYINTTGSSSNLFTSLVQSTTTSQMFGSASSASVSVYTTIKGTVTINTGGTFTPQYTANVAPGGAYTTRVGSYFKITPIGTSGTNISRGIWS